MKSFFRQNGILLLIIAFLMALIIAVVSLLFGGSANPFSNAVGVIATPFRDGVNKFVRWTEKVTSERFQKENMEKKLEELLRENARLKEQAREGEAASRENDRLRSLVKLAPKNRSFDLEPASVTARSISNWTSTLTVNKGSAAGIEPGDCVVDQYWNLVGVVEQTGLNWSMLITIVDTDIEIGARIARTDDAAMAEGDFALMGEGRLKLTYLPEGVQLLAGDEILTSGLISGGRANYPSRLLIGTVEQVRSDAGGVSDYAILRPASEWESLEQVFIVKSFEIVE